jgi:RNA-directed DNA polymerase
MSVSVVEMVADYLGLDPTVVTGISKNAHKTYRRYQIPKKKGGFRSIFHPSKVTKSLQYAIIETVLREFPIHDCAMGYVRGLKSPLLQNAKKHAGFRYSLHVDFEDFFPSIGPSDLVATLRTHVRFEGIDAEDQGFLGRCLFVKYPGGNLGLAIGAPSSPSVSNIVMHSLDEQINELAKSTSSESQYTRYADDIVFSTNKRGACERFFVKFAKLIDNTASPSLKINASKTVYTSRGTKRVITGLHVCPNGATSIGRYNKRYIRKLLFEYKNNRLAVDGEKYLRGYLSFILDVEPDLYNRLVHKYGAEVVARAHKGSPTVEPT